MSGTKLIPASTRLPLLMAALVVTLFTIRAFEPLETMAQDVRFMLRGYDTATESDVVVVGITSQCIDKLGEPPWPRSHYAKAIDTLVAADVAVIALDVCFQSQRDKEKQSDAQFVDAVRRAGNVVLPVFCPVALRSFGTGGIRRVDDLTENFPALSRAAAGLGHINLPPSLDSRRRFAPWGIEHNDRVYLNLGLESAFKYLEVKAKQGRTFDVPPADQVRSIPVNDEGEFVINYMGQHATLDLFPFHWLLQGRLPADLIRGKLVLIGQTALGRKNADLIPTPLGEMYGVFAQAAIMDNVLSRRFLVRQGYVSALIMILLLSLVSGVAFRRLSWGLTLVGGALSMFLVAFAAFFAFNRFGHSVEVVPCLAVLAGNFLAALVMNLHESWQTVEHQEMELGHILHSSQMATERVAARNAPQMLISLIGQTIGCEFATLCLRKRDGSWSWTDPQRRSAGEDELTPARVREFEEEANVWLGKESAPYLTYHLSKDARFPATDLPAASFLSVPLVVQESPIGHVNLYNKTPSLVSPTGEYTEDDLRLVAVLCQQAALLLDNSMLVEDLEGRNAELRQAMIQLREAQDELVRREKLSTVGKMASMIIHDIRGPLTALMGFGELMKGRDMPEEEATEYGEIIVQETDRVNRMIQEILDFTRGTKSLKVEQLDGSVLLAELVRRLNDEFRGQEIQLVTKIPGETSFRGDREKMLRVLLNLCRNAAEAMNGRGSIEVAYQDCEDGVKFVVRDDGPGVPESIRDKLFDPFVTAGKKKGTGLGLAIVQKIVHDHDGDITVSSESDSGTTFTVQLPTEGTRDAAAAAAAASQE